MKSDRQKADLVSVVLRLHVAGMDCADEAALLRHVLKLPGIDDL